MTNFDFGVTFGKSEAPAAFGDMLAVRVENKRRQDYDAKKTAFEAQQKNNDKNNDFIQESFALKNVLTGDPLTDSFINKRQPEIIQFATDFLTKNPGIDQAAFRQTLTPYIAELAMYKQKAKEYAANKEQLVNEYKGVKGINAERVGGILNEHMFKNTGSVADMKTDIDSLRSALQGREKDLVVGDEGLKSVLDGQGKGVVAKMVKTRDGSGRTVSTEKKYNLPTFATIGDDGQPTVKAETFSLNTPPSAQKTIVNGRELDSNQKIAAQTYLQDVMSTNGNIQLMEEGTFNQLMQDRSFAANIAAATQAYMDDYEQQNKEKFPRGTVSELMLQRAVAFNKASQYLNSNVLDKQTTSQPIVINNSGGGGSKDDKSEEAPTVAVYDGIVNNVKKYPGKYVALDGGFGFSATEKLRIIDLARDQEGNQSLQDSNIALLYNPATEKTVAYLYDSKKKKAVKELFVLDQWSVDGAVQPNAKAKQAVAEKSKQNAQKKNNSPIPQGKVR